MRVLANIRYIAALDPIPGADRIEVATIDGWQCVVGKGQFNVNDKCVYLEVDSFVPNKEPFAGMLKNPRTHQGKEGFRIKTMKLRKQLSQGLALPLEAFDEDALGKVNLGDDVTERLGVIKYEADIKSNNGNGANPGTRVNSFPEFLRKTDQERIQNLPKYFTMETMQELEFEESLKLDGSSMTVYKKESAYTPSFLDIVLDALMIKDLPDPLIQGVASRNVDLKRPDNIMDSNFWRTAAKYKILDELPVGYAVQGELIAPNIQKNHEKVEDPEFYIFNVWDIKKQRYLDPEYARAFVREELPSAQYVPVVNEKVKIFKECTTMKELLERVEGPSMNPGTVSEGRVYKAKLPNGNVVSFKAISNKYLLKEK